MKDGQKGMGGMMDKMNGAEGMMRKMGDMNSKDQGQMEQKLKNMKNGDMQGMMKGGMQGMKQGMSDMMQKGMHSMMDNGDGNDMMSKMGGREGMMQMMGMTGGKDRDGNDMNEKFKGQMEQKKGQNSGPPSMEDMQGKKDMMGPNKSYRGGCAESLCCGHILEFGVWGEDYFCYNENAVDIQEDNMPSNRFKCVEGAAKLAAGLIAATAVLMMQ